MQFMLAAVYAGIRKVYPLIFQSALHTATSQSPLMRTRAYPLLNGLLKKRAWITSIPTSLIICLFSVSKSHYCCTTNICHLYLFCLTCKKHNKIWIIKKKKKSIPISKLKPCQSIREGLSSYWLESVPIDWLHRNCSPSMLAFLLDPLRPLASRHVAVRQGQCDAHLLQPGGNVERRKRLKYILE